MNTTGNEGSEPKRLPHPSLPDSQVVAMLRHAEDFLNDEELCRRFPQMAVGCYELLRACTVLVEVRDGVTEIAQVPVGLRVEVRDYDVEGADENAELWENDEGESCWRSVYYGEVTKGSEDDPEEDAEEESEEAEEDKDDNEEEGRGLPLPRKQTQEAPEEEDEEENVPTPPRKRGKG